MLLAIVIFYGVIFVKVSGGANLSLFPAGVLAGRFVSVLARALTFQSSLEFVHLAL